MIKRYGLFLILFIIAGFLQIRIAHALNESTEEVLKSELVHARSARRKREIHGQIARLLYGQEQWEGVIQEIKSAFSLNPKKRERRDWYPLLIHSYEKLRNFKEALKYAQAWAQISPKNYLVWSQLGYLYQAVELYDEALSAYEKALSIQPENLDVLLELASVAFLKDDIEKSERSALESLHFEPEEPRALAILSQVYERQGKYDQAAAYTVRALMKVPDAQGYIRLAGFQARSGYFEKAVENIRKARLMDSSTLQTDMYEGIYLWWGNNLGEADRVLAEANPSESDRAVVHLVHALVLWEKGDASRARREARAAYQLASSRFLRELASQLKDVIDGKTSRSLSRN